jgi:hypothetical protein
MELAIKEFIMIHYCLEYDLEQVSNYSALVFSDGHSMGRKNLKLGFPYDNS